jgi:hypothetical protein
MTVSEGTLVPTFPFENVAGRLLWAFSRFVEGGHMEQPVLHRWAYVFGFNANGLDATAVSQLQVRISELHACLDELSAQIDEQFDPKKAAVHRRVLPALREVLVFQNLAQAATGLAQHLSNSNLSLLELLASDLRQGTPVTVSEFDSVFHELHSLQNFIADSDLNPTLKKWLTNLLAEAKRSMDLFQVRGARGFRDALRSIYGECFLYRDLFRELRTDKTAWDKFREFVDKLNDAAKKADEYRPLLEAGIVGAAMLIENLAN